MRTLIVTLALALMIPATVRADVAAAAHAFSEGQAAQLDGDYDRAAQNFELAYTIAPAKEALRSAVRARQMANQLPRAATLAEILIARYGDDPDSVKLANEVIAVAKPQFARIAVRCTEPCSLAIGNRALSIAPALTHAVFANAGNVTIDISFATGEPVTRALSLAAGNEISLTIEAPTPKPEVHSMVHRRVETAPRQSGLSPIVPITGAVVTVGLAGVAIWSGLDTIKAHDRYVASPTPAGWTDGRSRQLRTNILIGSATAVGVGTALVATFWTRWQGSAEQPPVAFSAAGGHVAAWFGGTF